MTILHRDFANMLLQGDTEAAVAFIRKYKEMERIAIFQDIVTPALYHIGELWEQNEISVADEHLATASCDFVLSRIYPSARSEDGRAKKAMFFCLEGEQHYLGLKMVNSYFEELGWNTKYFGPNLPLQYALSYARDWRPDVIGMSISIVYNLPQLKKYIEEFCKLPHKPALLVGGRLAGRYELDTHCQDQALIMKDLSSLKQWLSQTIPGEKMNVL
ncbi:B12-binding domain-containing protein [Peribacillus sp. SCS-26]|uniref:cobalamin B12-binding domain-containing protein n=1 Tax=Paraperibacillus marinus TaxID=3115295 RepID=UPI0039059080